MIYEQNLYNKNHYLDFQFSGQKKALKKEDKKNDMH
jgi:hypothetical protein